jgi:hypothetical protein
VVFSEALPVVLSSSLRTPENGGVNYRALEVYCSIAQQNDLPICHVISQLVCSKYMMRESGTCIILVMIALIITSIL